MHTMQVSLGERSYPILISQSLLFQSNAFWPLREKEKVLVVTNDVVAPLYLQQVCHSLMQSGSQVESLILPDGEQFKSLETLNKVYEKLLQGCYGRDCTLVALGGGVIGDLVGFAAATYQRGVRFIQVPTTLLSQVDSSVGGKTAVNHLLGKNMIGAFYQPASVIIDTDTLSTLPMREFSSGLAEVIKYGIIMDYDFFVWLEHNIESLLNHEPDALTYCIQQCCRIKADIVAKDETEQGLRALLNLGHTFGHAIEAEMGYGNWLHGEAVAVGMLMAARVANQLGYFTEQDISRIQSLLSRAGLPDQRPSEMATERYLPHMMRDKKNKAGCLRLVLPIAIGQATIVERVENTVILSSIKMC